MVLNPIAQARHHLVSIWIQQMTIKCLFQFAFLIYLIYQIKNWRESIKQIRFDKIIRKPWANGMKKDTSVRVHRMRADVT